MPLSPSEALEVVVGRTKHERFRDFLNPDHPDYSPAWEAAIVAMAEKPVEPDAESPPNAAAGGDPQPRPAPRPYPGPFAPADDVPAPTRTRIVERPWEGTLQRKPWDYRVTAIVPHLDTPELLRVVVETLRLQIVRPYILVIDTGSLAVNLNELARLEFASDDLEVHYMRPRGWQRICEPVCAAMDLGFALARTDYAYSTHTDVFLKTRDHLAWLVERCDAQTPAVGYRMFDRSWASPLWSKMLGHCWTVYHLPTCRQIGLSWNYERARERLGLAPERCVNGWPDTEVGAGLCFLDAGFGLRTSGDPAPDEGDPPSILAVGQEVEYTHEDERIDHPRSVTGRNLYDRSGASDHEAMVAAAVSRATTRIEEWRKETGFGCGGCPASHDYPSLWRMAKNLATAAVDIATSGFQTVPGDMKDARLSVCESCSEWFDPGPRRCKHPECGCFVEEKARWTAQKCPIGKW